MKQLERNEYDSQIQELEAVANNSKTELQELQENYSGLQREFDEFKRLAHEATTKAPSPSQVGKAVEAEKKRQKVAQKELETKHRQDLADRKKQYDEKLKASEEGLKLKLQQGIEEQVKKSNLEFQASLKAKEEELDILKSMLDKKSRQYIDSISNGDQEHGQLRKKLDQVTAELTQEKETNEQLRKKADKRKEDRDRLFAEVQTINSKTNIYTTKIKALELQLAKKHSAGSSKGGSNLITKGKKPASKKSGSGRQRVSASQFNGSSDDEPRTRFDDFDDTIKGTATVIGASSNVGGAKGPDGLKSGKGNDSAGTKISAFSMTPFLSRTGIFKDGKSAISLKSGTTATGSPNSLATANDDSTKETSVKDPLSLSPRKKNVFHLSPVRKSAKSGNTTSSATATTTKTAATKSFAVSKTTGKKISLFDDDDDDDDDKEEVDGGGGGGGDKTYNWDNSEEKVGEGMSLSEMATATATAAAATVGEARKKKATTKLTSSAAVVIGGGGNEPTKPRRKRKLNQNIKIDLYDDSGNEDTAGIAGTTTALAGVGVGVGVGVGARARGSRAESDHHPDMPGPSMFKRAKAGSTDICDARDARDARDGRGLGGLEIGIEIESESEPEPEPEPDAGTGKPFSFSTTTTGTTPSATTTNPKSQSQSQSQSKSQSKSQPKPKPKPKPAVAPPTSKRATSTTTTGTTGTTVSTTKKKNLVTSVVPILEPPPPPPPSTSSSSSLLTSVSQTGVDMSNTSTTSNDPSAAPTATATATAVVKGKFGREISPLKARNKGIRKIFRV